MDLDLLLNPIILSEILLNGAVRGSLYALMGCGLSLIFGLMGVKNFSHGEFFMLGTCTMFFVAVMMDMPLVVGIFAAGILPGARGLAPCHIRRIADLCHAVCPPRAGRPEEIFLVIEAQRPFAGNLHRSVRDDGT